MIITYLNDNNKAKAVFDIYLKREITPSELHNYLELIRPKELKRDSELT